MTFVKRLICALMLVSAVGWASADTIRISASITTPDVVFPPSFQINVTLVNTGDVVAHDVSLSVEPAEGFQSDASGVGSLEPNAPADVSIPVEISASAMRGTYNLILKTHYSDANGYPFTTVTPVVVRIGQPAAERLKGSIDGVTIRSDGESELTIHLSNLDEARHMVLVSLYLPDELKPAYGSIKEDVQDRGAVTFSVPLSSQGALPGSTYPVYAIAEYDDGDVHYSFPLAGMVTVVAPPPSETPEWLPAAAVAALLAAIGIYQVWG